MSFKKYVEAVDIAESILSSLFGSKKEPAKVKSDLEKDAEQLEPVEKNVEKRKRLGQKDTDAANAATRRFEPGNLYDAFNFYNGMIDRSGYHYPPEMVSRISQSEFANSIWDEKYRKMFLRMKDTPAMAKMLLDKAFAEMGLPKMQPTTPPFELVPDEPEVPDFSSIVNYIKMLLDSGSNLTREEIKKRVKDKWPGLKKYKGLIDARIGKAFTKAAKSMIKLHKPEPEPKLPTNKNILKFPGTT